MAQFPKIIGINQLLDEVSMADEESMFVRTSINTDIDVDGNFSRRKGATLDLAGAGYHSLYASQRGWLMMCHYNELGIYSTDTATFTSAVTMEDNYPTSFTEANGILYAMNPSFSGMFLPDSTTIKGIGVPLPSVEPEFGVLSSGGMEEGVYGIAYSVVDADDEESGLSRITTLDIPANGGVQGILFTITSGYRYRVYMTAANGEELRQAVEFDADTTTIQILVPETGRLTKTFGLEPLPKGHIIRAFGSRLLVAGWGKVWFSEAFRPHLADPTGFILATGLVTMVEPVGSGVFIADNRGVRFYKGEDPTTWVSEEASPEKVVFGTSTIVSGKFFQEELTEFDEIAVWLTSSGYQLGLPTGEVLRLNASQVKLPAYTQGCTTTVVADGRKQLLTPVNSNKLAHANVALDSTTL